MALSIHESLTLKYNRLALEIQARGEKVIKLTAGEPDFETPAPIVKAAYEAMKAGKTKYAPAAGIRELREAIAIKYSSIFGNRWEPSQVIITNGGKQAIYLALKAILEPGDEVIILTPSWVSYESQVLLNRGKPVFVSTDRNFLPDPDLIRSKITGRTKALIINSPNNPTGTVYPSDLLKEIAEIVLSSRMYVISDEVYRTLVYEGEHTSISSFNGMHERTVLVDSFSKSHAMTGWRIGFLLAPDPVAEAISKIMSHTTGNVNTPSQWAALEALKIDTGYMVEEFRKRRDFVIRELQNMGIDFHKPAGAFYCLLDVSKYCSDDTIFVEGLLKKERVAMVPGQAFRAAGTVRMSFTASMDDLKEGLQRLNRYIIGKAS